MSWLTTSRAGRRTLCGLSAIAAGLLFLGGWLPTRYVASSADNRHLEAGTARLDAFPLPLNVSVWNICKGSQPGFLEDFHAVASSRDLLLLQEYMQNDPVQDALGALTQRMQVDAGISFRFRGKSNAATGVATASAVGPIKAEAWISDDREPLVATPKATLLTWYPIVWGTNDAAGPSGSPTGRARLLVINIHGINFVGFQAFKRQLDRVRPVVEEHQGPVIFAGDFNTNTRKKRNYLAKLADELNLNEMAFEPDGRMTAPFGSIPLDHVYTRGLAVERCRVFVDCEGSDHKAMTFRVGAVLSE